MPSQPVVLLKRIKPLETAIQSKSVRKLERTLSSESIFEKGPDPKRVKFEENVAYSPSGRTISKRRSTIDERPDKRTTPTKKKLDRA